MRYIMKISGDMHEMLKSHLLPGDGNEAMALALCGRHKTMNEEFLLVHKIIPIPYDECEIRRPDFIKWSTKRLIQSLETAEKEGLAIVKIHSHPGGWEFFSKIDDQSDKEIFESVFSWLDSDEVHGSAIMLPDGELFARVVTSEGKFIPIDRVSLIGHDLKFWDKKPYNGKIPEAFRRTAQAFGDGTTNKLKFLKIGVVGCSGTGSPLIHELVRLGVGKLVIVDPDLVEEKNLNRILSTKKSDIGSEKVFVIKKDQEDIGLGTIIKAYPVNLYDSKEAINEIASCDAVFGGMDTVDGRDLLNQISTFYLLPYIDLGVKLMADGNGGIDQIIGAIHYLHPGGSSLSSRGMYTPEMLRAAYLYRKDPAEYVMQKKFGYIANVPVERPAVISVNMQVASLAAMEFLARIHPYRYESNKAYAYSIIDFCDWDIQKHPEGVPDIYLAKFVGRGRINPLLNSPDLS